MFCHDGIVSGSSIENTSSNGFVIVYGFNILWESVGIWRKGKLWLQFKLNRNSQCFSFHYCSEIGGI